MNISSVNRTQSQDAKPKTDKIGVMLAQKSLEAARQNQEGGGTVRTGKTTNFAHPYLGHNIDIYV